MKCSRCHNKRKTQNIVVNDQGEVKEGICESQKDRNNEFFVQQYSLAGDIFFLFYSLVITKNDNSATLDIKYLLRVSSWTVQMTRIKCFISNTTCLKAKRQGTLPHSPDCLSWQGQLIFSSDKKKKASFFLKLRFPQLVVHIAT